MLPVVATTQTAITIDEDTSTVLTVSLSDVESAVTTLVVTTASSNQSLILNSSITQRGSTSALTSFDVTPVTNANGVVNVEFTASDGTTTATTTLTITINAVNDAPVIATNQTAIVIDEDTSTVLTVSIR